MNGLPAKVSIIIPVYNTESYLSACLSSCIHQTLLDIEIICVNDGSTDSSLDILHAFAEKDNRVKVIDKPNGGVSSARNAGIQHAYSEMIMFLDSDDYLAINACERAWKERLDHKADIVVFGAFLFPDEPRPWQWMINKVRITDQLFTHFTPEVLFKKNGSIPFACRQAFSSKLIKDNGLQFDERVRLGEDTVFQLEVFPHANRFAYISDELYYYRWFRRGSAMYEFYQDPEQIHKRRLQHLHAMEISTKYWFEKGWLNEYGADYLDWMIKFLIPQKPNPLLTTEYSEGIRRLLKEYRLTSYFSNLPKETRLRITINGIR